MEYKEVITKIPYLDISIASKEWGEENSNPILSLHGWLDNASSFDHILPYIKNQNIIAIDFIGHGNSSHLPNSAIYSMNDYMSHVIAYADQRGWEKFSLMGHSLGACVATLVAGAIPDRINKLALIEGIGPLTSLPTDLPKSFLTYFNKRKKIYQKKLPIYKTIEDAARTRAKLNNITYESALTLATRGTRKEGTGITWISDQKLTVPSAQRLTEDQLLAYIRNISSPSCLILATEGYNFDNEKVSIRRQELKNLEFFTVPGMHHMHMDTPKETGEILNKFLNN